MDRLTQMANSSATLIQVPPSILLAAVVPAPISLILILLMLILLTPILLTPIPAPSSGSPPPNSWA